MSPLIFDQYITTAALNLFDLKFSTPQAQAMILAIGLQESDFKHRRQLIGFHRNWWESLKGPAAGYFQFERIGIRGVLEHHTTGDMARTVLKILGYPEDVDAIHRGLVHNDMLAAAFARLALYRIPDRLPEKGEYVYAWQQYLEVWRPGKPHPDRWPERFADAWRIVEGHDLLV